MEEQKIYIGPNVPALGLQKFQVYLGGLPGQVRAALALFPEIEELIVPVENFSELRHQAETKGTHLHHVYTEFARKVGKD